MTPEASLPADFDIHNHITPFTRRLCAAAPESVLAVRPEDLVEDVFPYIQDPEPLNVPTNAFLLITGLYLPSAGITAATKTIRGTSVIATSKKIDQAFACIGCTSRRRICYRAPGKALKCACCIRWATPCIVTRSSLMRKATTGAHRDITMNTAKSIEELLAKDPLLIEEEDRYLTTAAMVFNHMKTRPPQWSFQDGEDGTDVSIDWATEILSQCGTDNGDGSYGVRIGKRIATKPFATKELEKDYVDLPHPLPIAPLPPSDPAVPNLPSSSTSTSTSRNENQQGTTSNPATEDQMPDPGSYHDDGAFSTEQEPISTLPNPVPPHPPSTNNSIPVDPPIPNAASASSVGNDLPEPQRQASSSENSDPTSNPAALNTPSAIQSTNPNLNSNPNPFLDRPDRRMPVAANRSSTADLHTANSLAGRPIRYTQDMNPFTTQEGHPKKVRFELSSNNLVADRGHRAASVDRIPFSLPSIAPILARASAVAGLDTVMEDPLSTPTPARNLRSSSIPCQFGASTPAAFTSTPARTPTRPTGLKRIGTPGDALRMGDIQEDSLDEISKEQSESEHDIDTLVVDGVNEQPLKGDMTVDEGTKAWATAQKQLTTEADDDDDTRSNRLGTGSPSIQSERHGSSVPQSGSLLMGLPSVYTGASPSPEAYHNASTEEIVEALAYHRRRLVKRVIQAYSPDDRLDAEKWLDSSLAGYTKLLQSSEFLTDPIHKGLDMLVDILSSQPMIIQSQARGRKRSREGEDS